MTFKWLIDKIITENHDYFFFFIFILRRCEAANKKKWVPFICSIQTHTYLYLYSLQSKRFLSISMIVATLWSGYICGGHVLTTLTEGDSSFWPIYLEFFQWTKNTTTKKKRQQQQKNRIQIGTKCWIRSIAESFSFSKTLFIVSFVCV